MRAPRHHIRVTAFDDASRTNPGGNVPGPFTRAIAVLSIAGVVLAACGNSGESSGPTTAPVSTASTAAGAGDRDTFVSISGVPGVTDDEISYAAIGTRANNPLGTCILDCYLDGIKAYFAFRNSEGGIFGRDLVAEPGARRRARAATRCAPSR